MRELEREHARLSAARALGERHPHWYLHRGMVWWVVFSAAVIGAVLWAGREGAAVLARVDAPSMPRLSLPDLPGVPWLTVAWVVAVLAVVGLAVWLWHRRSYGLPWRYRLRRLFRRY